MKAIAKRLIIITAMLAALLTPVFSGDRELFRTVDRLISRTVPLVSREELDKNLNKDSEIILLDTRKREEYAVSHLKGARWVGFESFDLSRVKDIPRDQIVVVYCSIGYRSEKIGEKLQNAGFTQVKNLYGGIFSWANQGRAMLSPSDQPTKRVHGYDAQWSEMLNPELTVIK